MSVRSWYAVIGVAFLAACANMPQGQTGGDVLRPAADKPATTEQRARAKAHVELGNAYLQANKLGVALDEAKTALSDDASYAPAQLLMGQVHAFLGEFEQARPFFEEASRLAPGDPEINNAYGWFLCNRGEIQDGVTRIEQAARNPYNQTPAMAWTNVGLCQILRKDDKAAEAAFLRAVQVDAGNLRALFNLSEIAYRAGNYPRAREWFLALQQRLKKPSAETLWLGLRIERQLGNREAAADYALQLRRDFASSSEFQLLQQGKFD